MLREFYKDIISQLSNSGIDSAEIDARFILEERCGITWSDILSDNGKGISSEQRELIKQDINQRISGKPLSRIYGEREFWGLPFEISEDTLDPRPDTETIIDLALGRFDKSAFIDVLDLGTGSGCILISLLSEFENARGIGVDVSQDAVVMAQKNSIKNNVQSRIGFINGSWFDAVDGKFDLIVSNPPYIRSDVIPDLSDEVKNHDPILALDGGQDGLAPYEIIFSQIKNFLKPRGIGLFEIGYDQKDDVMRLAEKYGFAQRCVHLDMAGNPRVVEISCGDK